MHRVGHNDIMMHVSMNVKLSKTSLFDRPNNLWWQVQIMKLLYSLVTSYLLRTNVLLSTLSWNTLGLCPAVNMTPRSVVSLIRNIDRVQHVNNKTDAPAVPLRIHIQARKQQKDNHETSHYTAHCTAQIDEIPRIHAEQCMTSRQSAILKALCDILSMLSSEPFRAQLSLC